jgi:hypothetical protein
MNYLSPSEYGAFGLEATTPAHLVAAASALIDSYCRRTTLAVAEYVERLRLDPGRNTVRASYLPLVAVAPATTPIVAARGRYGIPRRGDNPSGELAFDVAQVFSLPGSWTQIDSSAIDYFSQTGELALPLNPLGLWYSELELTYTAGLDPLLDLVKSACAQLVRNAQATPALNVKMGKLDRFRLDYFSDSLLDENIRRLLAPYVAQKVG